MEIDPQVQQKVAAALLIIQIVVVISVFIGAVISGYWSRSREYFYPNGRGILSSGVSDFALLLIWLFLSIIPILLTPFFKIGWDALGFSFTVVAVRRATGIAMCANIIFCAWFIFRSGGWNQSPFVSVMGAIPAFAILIGEPISRTIWYVVAIALLMGIGTILSVYRPEIQYSAYSERGRHGIATWLLATAMLLLTTALGYIRSLPFA